MSRETSHRSLFVQPRGPLKQELIGHCDRSGASACPFMQPIADEAVGRPGAGLRPDSNRPLRAAATKTLMATDISYVSGMTCKLSPTKLGHSRGCRDDAVGH